MGCGYGSAYELNKRKKVVANVGSCEHINLSPRSYHLLVALAMISIHHVEEVSLGQRSASSCLKAFKMIAWATIGQDGAWK